MKIKQTMLGVMAGLALTGSAMTHNVKKADILIAKNDTITNAVKHINLPKPDSTDTFVAQFIQDSTKMDSLHVVAHSKKGEVISAPKSSIKIVDLETKKDITKDINAIDSTIIKDGGIDMYKVDSLEYEARQKAAKNLANEDYQKLLNNAETQNYKKVVDVKKVSKTYRTMKKADLVDKKGNVHPLDSVQKQTINEKMKQNDKYWLLAKVGHPHVDVMVKTRSVAQKGKDLYQQAEMNFLGEINKLTTRGKVILDTINPKAAEAKTKFEDPMCGKIGYKTTEWEYIVANTCDESSKPSFKRYKADSLKMPDTLIVRDLPPKPEPKYNLPPGIVLRKDNVVTSKPIKEEKTIEHKVEKGETIWGIAKKSLGENAKEKDIIKLTKTILNLNGMTAEQAKYMKINAIIRLPEANQK